MFETQCRPCRISLVFFIGQAYHGNMIIRRAYRFKLKTNARQNEYLSRFAGCCRLVWNRMLAVQKKRLDQQLSVLNYSGATAELVPLKSELPFLREVHSQPLQQVLKDQDRALRDAFKKSKGFPKFKKKGRHDRFRYPQGVKLEGNRIYLPKLGWFAFYKSQEIDGAIKNVTVSRLADDWFVAIQVEIEKSTPKHASQTEVGIDVGVVNFATLSDGTVIAPVNSFRKLETKLTRAQQTLSRRVKKSSNWIKQIKKIRKTHIKIADTRRDFLHKTTTEICKNHAVVHLEDLQVRNMSKSAKGSLDKPGNNVAAKAGLNKSILDQSWYEFRRQLIYKQEWRGGKVVLVNPRNTSRMCSICKTVAAENRQSQSKFVCVGCGHVSHADLNAARNILAAGRAVNACGDISQVAVLAQESRVL
jgi:putative transposase